MLKRMIGAVATVALICGPVVGEMSAQQSSEAGPVLDDGQTSAPAGGGVNLVEVRNASGGLTLVSSVPTGSALAGGGAGSGGAPRACGYSAWVLRTAAPDPDAAPGAPPEQEWVKERRTTYTWRSFELEPPVDAGVVDAMNTAAVALNPTTHDREEALADIRTLTAPLAPRTRRFRVECNPTRATGEALDDVFQYDVDVGLDDPLLDPHSRLAELRNNLQLVRPEFAATPTIIEYGGVVVRNPVWLAINSNAWRTQMTPIEEYAPDQPMGVFIALAATPRELAFEIEFTPADDALADGIQPSHVTIACVTADDTTVPTTPTLPARPHDLADWSEQTGPTGRPCTWVPPGNGTVTVTAHVVYTTYNLINGMHEPAPDYHWASTPITYPSGELRILNTRT